MAQEKKYRTHVVPLILLFSLVILIRVTGFSDFLTPEYIQGVLGKTEMLGPVVYILIYICITCLSLPTLPITALSGVIYGHVLGVTLSLLGANAGAMLSFLIARYFARGYIERMVEGRFEKIEKKLQKGGWIFLASIRTVPVLPFALINYSFGLTSMSFAQYAVVSFVFMIPSTVLYVVFGISIKEYLVVWLTG